MSKVCSVCGHKLESLPLQVRKWGRPVCGILHDRDVNAALNIARITRREASGLRVEEGVSIPMGVCGWHKHVR